MLRMVRGQNEFLYPDNGPPLGHINSEVGERDIGFMTCIDFMLGLPCRSRGFSNGTKW